MIFNALVTITSGLLGFAFIIITWTAIKTYICYVQHKRSTKGMKMLSGFWPIGGHLHKMFFDHYNWLFVTSYHYMYGKTFAFMKGDQPAVSTIDLDLIKRICVDEANIHTARIHINGPIKEMEQDTIMVGEGEQVTRIRNSIAPAMTRSRMDHPGIETHINSAVSKLLSVIHMKIKRAEKESSNQTGAIICIEDLVHRCVVDFVLSLFYKQKNKIDYECEEEHLLKAINFSLKSFHMTPFNLGMIFPILKKLFLPLVKFSRIRNLLMKVVNEQTKLSSMGKIEKKGNLIIDDTITEDTSLETWQNPTDYFYDKLAQNVVTKEEYINTSLFFFAAANKTVTDAVVVLIYYLALNPDVQEKLRNEIKTKGVDSEYLTWCIDEVLRLYPPAPITCTRTTARDVVTDKFTIAKGTIVLVPGYTIHRSTEYWGEDADKFKPERWADMKQLHPMQFIPFGTGRRICLGMHLAQKAMRMMIVALLGRYKMERCEKTVDKLLFATPLYIFLLFDEPVYVRASFLDAET